MKILYAAERYIRVAQHVEALKRFDTNVQGSPVSVIWNNGSSLGGYHELRAAIGEIVSEGWEALKAEAIRRAEAQLAEAEAALRSALTQGCDSK